MKLKNCPLRNELKKGLLNYERDNNVSPLSLIESLVEEHLYKKGYLSIVQSDEIVPFPTQLNNPPIKNVFLRENGKYQVMKFINGRKQNFMSGTYEEAKEVASFLKRNGWDLKYSTSQTKLRGQKQIDYLFEEMEKEKEL